MEKTEHGTRAHKTSLSCGLRLLYSPWWFRFFLVGSRIEEVKLRSGRCPVGDQASLVFCAYRITMGTIQEVVVMIGDYYAVVIIVGN